MYFIYVGIHHSSVVAERGNEIYIMTFRIFSRLAHTTLIKIQHFKKNIK